MPQEQMWTEKYRPTSLDDYRGAKKTVEKVLNWVENWENRKTKSILLHGPQGSGKTTLAHLVAENLGMEVYETNASDVRTKKALQESLEQAVQQRSLTGRKKLILIDEVDGMSAKDRGGRSQIGTIIDKSRFPVIMTANDAYANGMQTLRRKSNVIEMSGVHTNSITARLKGIAEQEGVEYDDNAIKSIARRAGGDIRSAINDLQTLAERHGTIDLDTVKELGYRDTEKGIFDALKILFKTTTASTASDALDYTSEDHSELLQWIRENVPKEYQKKEDVARAMDAISKADLFQGRMRKNQDWTLLKYVYELMSVGVALGKDEKYKGFTRYSYPSRIKKMGRSKAARSRRDDIATKIGDRLHTSISTATDLIPYLQLFFTDQDWKDNLVEHLELTEDEVEFIEDF